jgi:iron(II)-dependent oxidoreductase
MPTLQQPTHVFSDEGRTRRKRYLIATLVTCGALLALGISIHLIQLLDRGMEEMRSKATYDLSEMDSHVRAAGEEITIQRAHKEGKVGSVTYSVAEVDMKLSPAQWKELNTMIAIPAGSFIMGTNRRLSDVQDHPQHKVDLPAYKISKYPVTNAQYMRFVSDAGHRPPLNWNEGKVKKEELVHPVTMVSWYDAKAYCAWRGGRLPTEAEWEKASRGTDGRRWPWGNQMQVDNLNTYYNVGSTTDVTHYPGGASPYGVLDMAGNVSEWTADEFLPYKGSDAPKELFQAKIGVANSPIDKALKVVDMVPVNGRYVVMRGGSWKSDPFSTASYHRNYSFPNYASDFYGFRCAQDVNSQNGKSPDA